MANNNVQNVRFLRNGNLFTSRQAGLDALNGFTLTAEMDGSSILARYSGTTTGESPTTYIKTLVGYVYYKDESNKSITIFDIDDAGSDVDEKIKDAIEALDSNATSVDGKNVQVKVTETDGKIAAVNITTDNTVNSTDVANAIENAISDLDGSVIAETGYFVKSVTEADGKISGTTEALPTVAAISEAGKPITAVSENLGSISATAGTINAEFVNIADSGNKFTATTVEGALAEIDAAYKAADTAIIGGASASADTLGEIETIINQMKTDEKTYTIAEITSGLASNVRKAYKLIDEDGAQSGATIEIYKDSSLQSVELVNEDPTQQPAKQGQFLKFTYVTDSGTTDVVYLDVSAFLVEAEFKNGLQVINGEVSIKLDTNGDDTGDGKFLTVGANGLKLDGVSDAIAAAIDALDVTDTAVAGQYVATVSENDGVVSVTRANVSDAVLNGYAKGEKPASTAIAATDDVKGAISKLEHQIDDAKAAATTKVVEGTDAGNNLSISSATSETDGSTTYTIGLTDVASKTALDAEIAARKAVDGQNGQTYAANASANYISNANSLNDADVKLDVALKTADDAMLTGVAAGNGIEVTTKANKSQTISAKVNGDGGIVNDENGLHLGGIDCGTY